MMRPLSLNNSNLAGNRLVRGIRVASLTGVWFLVVVGGVDSRQVRAFLLRLLVLGGEDGLHERILLVVTHLTHEPLKFLSHLVRLQWFELELAGARFKGTEIPESPLNLEHQNTVWEVKTYQEAYPYYNATRNAGQHALCMNVAFIAQTIGGSEKEMIGRLEDCNMKEFLAARFLICQ